MNNVLRFKPGVLPITHLAPAGMRILAVLEHCARNLIMHDLTITCADKEHPETDPHSTGEAYDVRTHDLTDSQKEHVLLAVMNNLSDGGDTDPITPKDGGYVTERFFGWLEHKGQPNEHLHFQRRNHTVYP
jgi:hypothetical protein